MVYTSLETSINKTIASFFADGLRPVYNMNIELLKDPSNHLNDKSVVLLSKQLAFI